MRALIVTSILAFLAGTAIAQTSLPPAPVADPPGKRQLTTGSVGATNGKNVTSDALTSCLSQWDKATHMSKQEWGRACRRVADRLQNLTVK